MLEECKIPYRTHFLPSILLPHHCAIKGCRENAKSSSNARVHSWRSYIFRTRSSIYIDTFYGTLFPATPPNLDAITSEASLTYDSVSCNTSFLINPTHKNNEPAPATQSVSASQMVLKNTFRCGWSNHSGYISHHTIPKETKTTHILISRQKQQSTTTKQG